MSFKAASWAADQRGVSVYAKVLLQQLADRHNPDHGCFPDQQTLARDCEYSRATINRTLLELEKAGLVKRVKRAHEITGKRLPTRYFLAFEDGFSDVIGDRDGSQNEAGASESHVSDRDMENEALHVSDETTSMSQGSAKPCLTVETCSSSLTSKLTSKGTSKRAERADRATIFKSIWKIFPLRPGSSETEAWELFEKIGEADLPAVQKGAEHYSQWFREEAVRKGETYEKACGFAPFLVTWLRKLSWQDFKSWPLNTKPGSEAAEAMIGKITVNKWRETALFEACERVLGRSVPVGKSGSWTFDEAVVEKARARLGSGQGPP